MNALRVLAVASSEETRAQLNQQLQQLDYVNFEGVVLELSDAQKMWEKEKPDLLIMDLTGREIDACLFIEVINYNVENKTIVFGVHKELDPNVIVKAVSSGVKEFIHYPDDAAALEAAIDKHWTHLQKVAQVQADDVERSQGKIYPVFGSKGGVGSSTVAVNLAHQLVEHTQGKVVLFDMEQMFGNTAVMLNFKATYAISDLASEKPEEIDDDLLSKIVVHHETGLDIVVGCKSVMDDNPLLPPEHLERVMTYLTEHYDYIVVDLPTHVIDPYHQYFLDAASEVLLVSSLDIPGLYRTRQYLELVKMHMNTEKIKLVLNRWDLKAAVGMTNQNLEEEFKFPIFARLPNDWTLNIESMSLGKTLGETDPDASLVKSYRELAAELSGIVIDNKENEESKEKGLLKRFSWRKEPCRS